MDQYKKDYDSIRQKKRELSEHKTSGLRKSIMEALGDERRAVRVLDERTGDAFHVRLDERKTKCAPSLALIVQALEKMEVPTAADFVGRLNDVCFKTTKSLKMTKSTRVEAVSPGTTELKDLLLGFRQANLRRAVIREELKELRKAFAPHERRMAEALEAAGKDMEEGKTAEGAPFLLVRKVTRKRKRVPKSELVGRIEDVFESFKTAGRGLSTEQMAVMIYNSINPVHEEYSVVVK